MLTKQVKWRRPISISQCFMLVFLSVLFTPACITIHPPPPASDQAPCAFTWVNVWPGCNNTVTGGTHVTYKGTFTIYYVNGSDVKQLNSQNFTSNLTTLVLTANIPKNGTSWKWRISMQTTECTTCAAQDYNGDPCTQSTTSDGTLAAKSTRYGESYPGPAYFPALPLNFASLFIGQNVPSSCGCLVPNH